MYKYLVLYDGILPYVLSDGNRSFDEDIAPAWKVENTNLAGGLSTTEAPKKHIFSLAWADLPRSGGDDEGTAGVDDLEYLAEKQGATFTLRRYTDEDEYESFTVRIDSFKKSLVPASRRWRFSVSMTLKEV